MRLLLPSPQPSGQARSPGTSGRPYAHASPDCMAKPVTQLIVWFDDRFEFKNIGGWDSFPNPPSHFRDLVLTQIMPNGWTNIMGLLTIFSEEEVSQGRTPTLLTPTELAYLLHSAALSDGYGWHYLKAQSRLKIIEDMPNKVKDWKEKWWWVGGEWQNSNGRRGDCAHIAVQSSIGQSIKSRLPAIRAAELEKAERLRTQRKRQTPDLAQSLIRIERAGAPIHHHSRISPDPYYLRDRVDNGRQPEKAKPVGPREKSMRGPVKGDEHQGPSPSGSGLARTRRGRRRSPIQEGER